MPKYKTTDGVEVTAVQRDPDKVSGHVVWDITFPDGEKRTAHDSVFADNFEAK